jgi:hypothetical protein
LHHLVALELVLNLLVPRLPLLVLSAHSATHFGGFVVGAINGVKGVSRGRGFDRLRRV